MFCEQCGNELSEKSVFCSKCGIKVIRESKKSTKPKLNTTIEAPKSNVKPPREKNPASRKFPRPEFSTPTQTSKPPTKPLKEKPSSITSNALKYARVFLYIPLYLISYLMAALIIEVTQILPSAIGRTINAKEFIFLVCSLVVNIFLIWLTHKSNQISYSEKDLKAFSSLGKVNYFFAIITILPIFVKKEVVIDQVTVALLLVFFIWGFSLTSFAKKN